MRGRYLEVTFREGQPIAAYLHLPRQTTAPTAITADDINAVLEKIGQPALAPDELAPLAA